MNRERFLCARAADTMGGNKHDTKHIIIVQSRAHACKMHLCHTNTVRRHEQIFRFLKPQFAEIETYIEERGNIQYIDLKVFYAKLRGQLEFMTHSRAHRASTVSSVPDDYDRNSKTGVRGNDGEEKEIYTEAKTVDGKDSRGGDNNTESGDCTGRETGDSFNGGHTDHDHDNDSEEEYVLSGSEVEEGEREVLREAAQKSRLEQKKMANSKYTSTHDAARGVLKGVRKEERKKHKVALIQSDDRHNSLLNVDTVKTKPRSPSSSPSSPASPSNNKKKLFSDLLSTRGLKQYPLPRNDPPAIIPSLDFLSDYIGHHTKSFSIAESLIDVYFLCLMCQLVTLAVTEMLGKKSLYSKCLTSCNKLSCHFNRLGMPLLERLLRIEQKFFDDNLLVLSMRGIEKGMHYSDARHLIRKTRVFDQIFAALDIFILPTSIPAHTHGCKAISQSHLDPHFVLTGGYDTALRIWDTAHSKCLAQFMGHKSIVTWCSFNQLDNWVVSTSFDGTFCGCRYAHAEARAYVHLQVYENSWRASVPLYITAHAPTHANAYIHPPYYMQ